MYGTVRRISIRVAASGGIDMMGGAEIVVPIGILILLYFLFPAYLTNRRHRLAELLRHQYGTTFIKSGEVYIAGRWFRFPAVIMLTSDYVVIRNVLSMYNEEIPFERLRNLTVQYKLSISEPHPDDDSPTGHVLVITTTDHRYRILFPEPDDASEWKSEIEKTV
jgi:di/tricarboxylate transporter